MQSLVNLFSYQYLDQPLWIWALFLLIVSVILVIDLGLFNKNSHEIHPKESLKMCSIYVLIACLFGGWVWYSMGAEDGMDFYTGYLVEFSLSIDNIFVISMIFSYFAIPLKYQHRVLFYGILGAIILRGIMIIIGAELVAKFSWILYIFATFLLFSGIKMLVCKEKESSIGDNKIINFVQKHFRVTKTLHEQRFFIKRPTKAHGGKKLLYATPLFLALVVIEFSDVIFAVDSIPAIFVITQHAFIVFSSNIFAVLGLRSLYFLLADAVHRFSYLQHALAIILIFIGSKIFLAHFGVHIPSVLSLGITLSLLIGGVVLSLYKTKEAQKVLEAKTSAKASK